MPPAGRSSKAPRSRAGDRGVRVISVQFAHGDECARSVIDIVVRLAPIGIGLRGQLGLDGECGSDAPDLGITGGIGLGVYETSNLVTSILTSA